VDFPGSTLSHALPLRRPIEIPDRPRSRHASPSAAQALASLGPMRWLPAQPRRQPPWPSSPSPAAFSARQAAPGARQLPPPVAPSPERVLSPFAGPRRDLRVGAYARYPAMFFRASHHLTTPGRPRSAVSAASLPRTIVALSRTAPVSDQATYPASPRPGHSPPLRLPFRTVWNAVRSTKPPLSFSCSFPQCGRTGAAFAIFPITSTQRPLPLVKIHQSRN
jgi:hypothetical protein